MGYTNSLKASFGNNNQAIVGTTRLDYVLIRGYSSSEPTYIFGLEINTNSFSVNANSPIDYYNSTSQSVAFNCNLTDETGGLSLNLTINGSVYETVTGDLTTNLSLASTETLADGYWEWYCTGNDDTETTNTSTRYLTVDSTDPVISTATGLDNIITLTMPINSTWNYTANDVHLDSCYFNTTDNATYTVITCNATTNTTWATDGVKTIQFCANDTFGFETCDSDTISVYQITTATSDTPDPTVEGFDTTFHLDVNMSGIGVTTAQLNINGSVYNPTTTTAGTNAYSFDVVLNVPSTWGNTTGYLQDYYWNYTITGITTNQNSSTASITVYELGIGDCSAYTDVILNMSLLDEELTTAINESAGANFEIDLTLTSKTNSSITLDYYNTWTNENNPLVCIPANVLNSTQWWIDFTIGFDSTDHVWEFFYIDDGTLNSSKIFNSLTKTPLNLYDLKTADSTSFLFNYFDTDGLPVEDAIVHVFRKYIGSGTFREVERGKADQNGDTIVHLVEEDVIYYFVISQYGTILHTSSSYTALCQATPCTIQIEASSTGATFPTDWDLLSNGAYSISSSASTRVVNLTYQTDTATKMNLTVFKYNADGSYSPINTTSTTGTSGSIAMTVPQSAGNVSFFATVYADDEFKNSEWVDFSQKSGDFFGSTLSLFLAGLLILTLGLMAVSEGVGTLIFVMLGVVISGALGLIATELSTGLNIVIYLIIAGGILLWKLTKGRS